MVAYWFYIDGADTIIRMAVTHGTSLSFPSESLIIILLITQFAAFPSTLPYSAFGHKYTAMAIFGYFMTKLLHFYLLAVIIGLFQGGSQTLSQSYYTRFIPKQHSAGFLTMRGKFATIIGPLAMSVATLLTGNVRSGIVSLAALFAVGFILLRRVDEQKGRKGIEAFMKQQ